MCNLPFKTVVLLLALVAASGPVAEASMASFATPPCAAAMQAGQKNCCGSSCDCSIKTRTEDFSAVMPASTTIRFEIQSDVLELNNFTSVPVTTFHQNEQVAESPPKDPLYQTYSEYRL